MDDVLDEIRALRQEGTVKKYCDEFQFLFELVKNSEEMSEYYAIYLFIDGLEPEIRDVFITWHQYSFHNVKDYISLALKLDTNKLSDTLSPYDPESSLYIKDLVFDFRKSIDEIMGKNEVSNEDKLFDGIVHKVFDEMPKKCSNQEDVDSKIQDVVKMPKKFSNQEVVDSKIQDLVHNDFCNDAYEKRTLIQEMRVEAEIGHQEIMRNEYVPVFLLTSDKNKEKPEMKSRKESFNIDEIESGDCTAELCKGSENTRLSEFDGRINVSAYELGDERHVENCNTSDVRGVWSDAIPSGSLLAGPKMRDFIMNHLLHAAKVVVLVLLQHTFKRKAVVYMWHKWKSKLLDFKASGILLGLKQVMVSFQCLSLLLKEAIWLFSIIFQDVDYRSHNLEYLLGGDILILLLRGGQQVPWLITKKKLQQREYKLCASVYSTVGTHDYLTIEVLLKKSYGMECVCWSLGTIKLTYCKNMNWRTCLKLPHEPKVFREDRDLICQLLYDVDAWLGIGVKEIKVMLNLGGFKLKTCYNKCGQARYLMHLLILYNAAEQDLLRKVECRLGQIAKVEVVVILNLAINNFQSWFFIKIMSGCCSKRKARRYTWHKWKAKVRLLIMFLMMHFGNILLADILWFEFSLDLKCCHFVWVFVIRADAQVFTQQKACHGCIVLGVRYCTGCSMCHRLKVVK
ncbi:putative non-specific serine/threonine protein kinase [Helianthus annuus]|nr:putative non-specific serine/threonine protein kinase [Helianthus annuus]